MTPADPWSGIPDDLRKLVFKYAATSENPDYVKDAEIVAAEAALCAALRALVERAATRATLDEGWPPLAEIREVVESDEDSARMLTGFGRACLRKTLRLLDRGVTPGVAKEEAE